MAKALQTKKLTPADKYAGKRVRIGFEADVQGHYDACSTAPERVMVRIDGIITIVPVARVEVVR